MAVAPLAWLSLLGALQGQGQGPGWGWMFGPFEKLKQVNAIIAKLDDKKHIFFLDIGSKFLQSGDMLTKEIMPDFLHLTAKGYQIWADAISPKLAELMK